MTEEPVVLVTEAHCADCGWEGAGLIREDGEFDPFPARAFASDLRDSSMSYKCLSCGHTSIVAASEPAGVALRGKLEVRE